MKTCKYCGSVMSDDDHFCANCGKEYKEGAVCPHCGASVNEGDSFCQNCGKKLGDDSIGYDTDSLEIQQQNPDHRTSSKNIMYLSFGLLILLIIGCLWHCSNSNLTSLIKEEGALINDADSIAEEVGTTIIAPFETTVVTFKKTETIGEWDVEADIEVDYPKSGNEELKKNISYFIVDVLTDVYRNEKGYQITRYNGDISNGQSVVDYYGNDKIKELKELERGNASIAIKNVYETDKLVSFVVDFSGNNGGVNFSTKYGAAFDKTSGSQIDIISNPEEAQLKSLIISFVKKSMGELFGDDTDDSIYNELIEHPYPKYSPFIDKDGIHLVYQKYEIGSGAMGQIEVVIPISKIDSFLSDKLKSLL